MNNVLKYNDKLNNFKRSLFERKNATINMVYVYVFLFLSCAVFFLFVFYTTSYLII